MCWISVACLLLEKLRKSLRLQGLVCAQPDAWTNTINLKLSISMFFPVLKTIATYRLSKLVSRTKKTEKTTHMYLLGSKGQSRSQKLNRFRTWPKRSTWKILRSLQVVCKERTVPPFTVSHSHKLHKIDVSKLGRTFFETPKIMPKFDSRGLYKEG